MRKKIFFAITLQALSLGFAYAGEFQPCFDMSAEACRAFSLTNIERFQARLPSLVYAPACFDMAQEQSEDMARRHYFDHQRPASVGQPAEDFGHRAARFGLERGVGENIAQADSPERALEMWMRSPGHRRNILNPKFRRLGVGYQDGLYTQTFGD